MLAQMQGRGCDFGASARCIAHGREMRSVRCVKLPCTREMSQGPMLLSLPGTRYITLRASLSTFRIDPAPVQTLFTHVLPILYPLGGTLIILTFKVDCTFLVYYSPCIRLEIELR